MAATVVGTLGGKGVTLMPATLFAVANGFAKIDSSALAKLSDPKKEPTAKFIFSCLKDLTLEEARASLLLALNKLLLSSTGIGPSLLKFITAALETPPQTLSLDEAVDVTDDELRVLEKPSLYVMGAIAGLIGHQAPGFSAVVDAVAALSCEASGANVAAFNLIDSGDGHKGEVSVAGDLKVFLNGSKLVGKLESEAVSEIPQNHGALRECSRRMHSLTRAELNSAGKGTGGGSLLPAEFFSFAMTIRNLGEFSLSRAELNIDAISNLELKSSLKALLDRECPEVNVNALRELSMSRDYVKLSHEVNGLFDTVRKIVSWEAVTAFLSLEGGEVIDKPQDNGEEEEEGLSMTSPEKKKKKKVLGKGSSLLVQFFKDKLRIGGDEGVDSSTLLEKWGFSLLELLDTKNPSFPDLLSRVKEIVESNESRRLPKLPKGTRDFSREQMTTRQKAFSIITNVFERHGATALDTPAFELRETLMGKYGEDSKLIYDLADQGGELCALRYDLTVPFARFVAMNGITSLKRYQIAKVYRRDNPSKGRYREFYQCDFDIAGQHEFMGPDFEVVKVMTELLVELDIGDYEIKLNHRKLLDGMMEICGVPPEKFRTICSSIDKLDKMSFEQVKNEMVKEKGLSPETADTIGTFVKERGSPLELLSKLKREGKFAGNKDSLIALDELDLLFKTLESSKCIDKIVFDLSLARGLDYYTGVIFEAVFKGTTQVGSIAAGGRYDNLIGMFGKKQVPAVGVSLGIERVFTITEELQKARNEVVRANKTQVLVGVLGEREDLPVAASLVSELWAAGIEAEFMVSKRRTKHIERAKASKIPWLVIMGDEKIKEGFVKLKDVEATKEVTIERKALVEELQRRLSGASSSSLITPKKKKKKKNSCCLPILASLSLG